MTSVITYMTSEREMNEGGKSASETSTTQSDAVNYHPVRCDADVNQRDATAVQQQDDSRAAMQGLSASEQHFIRQRLHGPPGSSAKPLKLRFSRPSDKDVVERFVDAEAVKHGSKTCSWKALDMHVKWQHIQKFLATPSSANDDSMLELPSLDVAKNALLAGRLAVTYDTAKQAITRLHVM